MTKHQKDRLGMLLIAVQILAVAGWLVLAARIDASHGISVAQSLANWGF